MTEVTVRLSGVIKPSLLQLQVLCGDKLYPGLRVVRYRQLSSRATWPPVNLLSRLFAPFSDSDSAGGGGVCPGWGAASQ